MFTTAFVAMSLLTVNQEELELANNFARDQLIEHNILNATDMTNTDMQVNFLVMQNLNNSKKFIEAFLLTAFNINEANTTEKETLDQINELLTIFNKIVDEVIDEIKPELINLTKKNLSKEEIELLFASSLDDINQSIQKKSIDITQKIIFDLSEMIKPKIEALIKEIQVETEYAK